MESTSNLGRDTLQKTDSLLDEGATNYYRILDVDPRASRMEIREAYLRLKSTFNAGSAALYSLISEEEAQEQLSMVEESFRILNDDVARLEFDKRLGLGARREGSASGSRGAAALGDFVNDSAHSWSEGAAASAGTIRTARSSLPIIKLKASQASSDEMQLKMQELIQSSDPGDGDLFRRLREICKVSEDEIQERTKISVGYIQAIESNRFERLPQAVYVKGFLRSYFRYLSVPEAERLVTAFSARLQDWQANKKS